MLRFGLIRGTYCSISHNLACRFRYDRSILPTKRHIDQRWISTGQSDVGKDLNVKTTNNANIGTKLPQAENTIVLSKSEDNTANESNGMEKDVKDDHNDANTIEDQKDTLGDDSFDAYLSLFSKEKHSDDGQLDKSSLDLKKTFFEQGFKLPWEKEQESSLESQNEKLPWNLDSVLGQTSAEEKPVDSDHVILAPFIKKYSPLEKLQRGRHHGYRPPLPKENYTNMVDFERDAKDLMVFRKDIPDDQIFEKIEEFNPHENVISVKRYNKLVKDMKSAFKLLQLRNFATSKHVLSSKSSNKSKVVNKIIKDYWKISISDKVIDSAALQKVAHITLQNKRELFLLLSNTGFITNSWSRLGAKLTLNPEGNDLEVVGDPKVVNFVQVSWNELLNNVQSITLEMKDLKDFYRNTLHRDLPVDLVQELSDTFFDVVSEKDQLYILSAFTHANLIHAKVLLLDAANCSETVIKNIDKTFIDRYSSDASFREVYDSSLPWYATSDGPIYRLKVPKRRLGKPTSSFLISGEEIMSRVATLKRKVERAEDDFEYNFLEDASSVLGSLDAKKSEKQDKVTGTEDRAEPGDEVEFIERNIGMDMKRLNQAMLHPEIKKQESWLPNVLNATVGKVLFEKKSADSNVIFHSNSPELNGKITKLQLLDRSQHLFGIGGGVKNQFTHKLQVKLVPDGFRSLDNFKKLPNIEVWLDVIRKEVQIDSCDTFVDEYEYNYRVPLPQRTVDINFQSSYNSLLIDSNADDDLAFQSKQKPLFKFLHRIPNGLLKLEDNISLRKLIHTLQNRTVPIRMGDRKADFIQAARHEQQDYVPYVITEVNLKRTIELEYRKMPVIYEVINNGLCESYKVSLLSDVKEEMSQEEKEAEFKKFCAKVLQFVKFLDEPTGY